jgi:phosphate uptake regulator
VTRNSSDVETRKLQKVGGSTYSVSLPKEWATEHGLEAGMPIHLHPHADGSLVVRRARRNGGPLTETEITVPGSDGTTVRRALRAAYAVGYDTVKLVSAGEFDPEQRRAVRRFVGTMVGMSVAEETAARITVENLLDPTEVSIQQSVIQLQFTALSMQRAAVDALGDAAEADPLAQRDDDADRLFGMIERHFNRALTDPEEIDDLAVGRAALFEYYLTARQLERVADHAVRIATLADHPESAGSEAALDDLTALAERARSVVETATTATVDADADRAHEALDRRDAVIDDADALDRALFERSPPDAYARSRVLSHLVRTAACGGNIARVTLQASLRPDD